MFENKKATRWSLFLFLSFFEESLTLTFLTKLLERKLLRCCLLVLRSVLNICLTLTALDFD